MVAVVAVVAEVGVVVVVVVVVVVEAAVEELVEVVIGSSSTSSRFRRSRSRRVVVVVVVVAVESYYCCSSSYSCSPVWKRRPWMYRSEHGSLYHLHCSILISTASLSSRSRAQNWRSCASRKSRVFRDQLHSRKSTNPTPKHSVAFRVGSWLFDGALSPVLPACASFDLTFMALTVLAISERGSVG